ncbi:MAG: hypothetical protein ACHQEM_08595 [Chitinophagales bacterium]
MQTRFLFPHRFKAIGLIMSIPSFIFMMFNFYADYNLPFLEYKTGKAGQLDTNRNFVFSLESHNFTAELVGIIVIVGLLLAAFSKEKHEDERIATLRMESILWAVYVNTLFLIFSIIFFYSDLFLNIMTYNICTTLIFFIIRFNLVLYLDRRKLNTEAQ